MALRWLAASCLAETDMLVPLGNLQEAVGEVVLEQVSHLKSKMQDRRSDWVKFEEGSSMKEALDMANRMTRGEAT